MVVWSGLQLVELCTLFEAFEVASKCAACYSFIASCVAIHAIACAVATSLGTWFWFQTVVDLMCMQDGSCAEQNNAYWGGDYMYQDIFGTSGVCADCVTFNACKWATGFLSSNL